MEEQSVGDARTTIGIKRITVLVHCADKQSEALGISTYSLMLLYLNTSVGTYLGRQFTLLSPVMSVYGAAGCTASPGGSSAVP